MTQPQPSPEHQPPEATPGAPQGIPVWHPKRWKDLPPNPPFGPIHRPELLGKAGPTITIDPRIFPVSPTADGEGAQAAPAQARWLLWISGLLFLIIAIGLLYFLTYFSKPPADELSAYNSTTNPPATIAPSNPQDDTGGSQGNQGQDGQSGNGGQDQPGQGGNDQGGAGGQDGNGGQPGDNPGGNPGDNPGGGQGGSDNQDGQGGQGGSGRPGAPGDGVQGKGPGSGSGGSGGQGGSQGGNDQGGQGGSGGQGGGGNGGQDQGSQGGSGGQGGQDGSQGGGGQQRPPRDPRLPQRPQGPPPPGPGSGQATPTTRNPDRLKETPTEDTRAFMQLTLLPLGAEQTGVNVTKPAEGRVEQVNLVKLKNGKTIKVTAFRGTGTRKLIAEKRGSDEFDVDVVYGKILTRDPNPQLVGQMGADNELIGVLIEGDERIPVNDLESIANGMRFDFD